MKKRDEPIELFQLQALYKRIPVQHEVKNRVHEDLKKKITELNGLNAVDFPLQFIKHESNIIHDLRIEDEQGFFQMDILLLNSKCIVILEVKNWYGTLLFDNYHQVIRITDNKEEEGFENPILQVKLQKYRLRKWLHRNGFPLVPIKYLVIISFPSTIIKPLSASVTIPKEVIHSNRLILKYNEMLEALTNPVITKDGIHSLSETLLKAHTPKRINILEKYRLSASEIIKGVYCPKCETATMVKNYRKWICHSCNHESTNEYVKAINDYKWIFGNIASNKNLREFLNIECKHVMKRLIHKEGFVPIGNGRNRKYRL